MLTLDNHLHGVTDRLPHPESEGAHLPLLHFERSDTSRAAENAILSARARKLAEQGARTASGLRA